MPLYFLSIVQSLLNNPINGGLNGLWQSANFRVAVAGDHDLRRRELLDQVMESGFHVRVVQHGRPNPSNDSPAVLDSLA